MAETVLFDDDERTVTEVTSDGWPDKAGSTRSLVTTWKVETEQTRRLAREENLTGAIDALRRWAADAEATTVTQGNAVQVLNVVVDRLGVFFDRFADLLENR